MNYTLYLSLLPHSPANEVDDLKAVPRLHSRSGPQATHGDLAIVLHRYTVSLQTQLRDDLSQRSRRCEAFQAAVFAVDGYRKTHDCLAYQVDAGHPSQPQPKPTPKPASRNDLGTLGEYRSVQPHEDLLRLAISL